MFKCNCQKRNRGEGGAAWCVSAHTRSSTPLNHASRALSKETYKKRKKRKFISVFSLTYCSNHYEQVPKKELSCLLPGLFSLQTSTVANQRTRRRTPANLEPMSRAHGQFGVEHSQKNSIRQWLNLKFSILEYIIHNLQKKKCLLFMIVDVSA